MAVLAAVSAERGLAAPAGRLAEILAPYPTQVAAGSLMWLGSFSHHLGVLATTLGHRSEPESSFESAAQAHERMRATGGWPVPASSGRACSSLAASPGDDHTAGCLLAQSQAAARALDLAGIERRVAAPPRRRCEVVRASHA